MVVDESYLRCCLFFVYLGLGGVDTASVGSLLSEHSGLNCHILRFTKLGRLEYLGSFNVSFCMHKHVGFKPS